MTWKVFDSSVLTLGPLATGTFNFSSLFPGPAFIVNSTQGNVRYANLVRMRNNEFIFSMNLNVEDNLGNRVYENIVLVHLNLNPDNSITVDQYKKDIITNANMGNILQYADNAHVCIEDLHYLRRINDTHFAFTAQFDMDKDLTFWRLYLEDPMIVLGKLENDGSFTTGTPTIIQESSGGEYANFWVFQDTNEIVTTFESNTGARHYLNRNPAGAMPLTNYFYPGKSKDASTGSMFVPNFAALPADPVALGRHTDLYTTTDTGAFYAWNLDSSSWVQLTQLETSMFNQDGLGFDLWTSSSYGSPLWVLKYDTATLSITQKKLAADLNETMDYRNDNFIVDDLWRFHGVKMNDGRLAVNFTSSGRITSETNTTTNFMVISK